MTRAIEARGVVVELGGAPIVRGVDLAVDEGEVVALLGANGSGKSTLVRALVGAVPLASGSVSLLGAPLGREVDWARIGYVPQRVSAAGGVPATAEEVVVSGLLHARRLRPPRGARARALEALAAVGLADAARSPVHSLSGGQQQRVLIARALAGQPDVFVMDEPTAGVDAASQQALADVLATLVAKGRTVVLVMHELGPLEPLISRAVVLRDGVIVHDGKPPQAVGVHARPGHDHVHPHGPAERDELLRWTS